MNAVERFNQAQRDGEGHDIIRAAWEAMSPAEQSIYKSEFVKTVDKIQGGESSRYTR